MKQTQSSEFQQTSPLKKSLVPHQKDAVERPLDVLLKLDQRSRLNLLPFRDNGSPHSPLRSSFSASLLPVYYLTMAETKQGDYYLDAGWTLAADPDVLCPSVRSRTESQ